MSLVNGNELEFLIRIGVCLLCGFAIGIERELRNKPAGISTNCFVMGGACLFTFLSATLDPNSPARIAAQVVSGVGFLGAGMIIKGTGDKVKNLTTAASVWFSAGIGMTIGVGWFLVAGAATVYAVLIPRIPHVEKWLKETEDE
jgi:putative Mg2+ transporter-C (MgtC) family protein